MSGEQVTQQIQELDRLRSKIRVCRTTSALAVVIIAVGAAWCIISAVRDLVQPGPRRTEFVDAFQEQFSDEVVPEIKLVAQHTVEQLTPVLREELAKIDLKSPKIVAGVEKELEALKESLPNRAEAVMDTTVGDMIRIREGKIKRMYPNLTDEKIGVLMDNLVDEGQTRVVKVMDELFKPQQDTVDKIIVHLDEIEKVEAPNIKGEKPTWEMALTLFDIVKEDFEGLGAEDLTEAVKQQAAEVTK